MTDPFTVRIMGLDKPGLWALLQELHAEIQHVNVLLYEESVEHNRALRWAWRYRCDLAQARAALGSWPAILGTHWLAGIECDHDQRRDRAICACSAIDLGWCGTVGAAVMSWVDHVAALVEMAQNAKFRDTEALTGQSGTLDTSGRSHGL